LYQPIVFSSTMSRFACILLLIQLPWLLLSQDRLQFVGERIDFELNSSRFSINGIYFFANSSDREIHQAIFFPFGQGADSIQVKRVYHINGNHKIDYQLNANGIGFKIVVLPHDTIDVNIAYSRKTKPENIYVLKSTRAWGKALQSAKYSLTVEKSVKIKSVSYSPDRIDGNIYYWNKKDFFPMEDFVVRIK